LESVYFKFIAQVNSLLPNTLLCLKQKYIFRSQHKKISANGGKSTGKSKKKITETKQKQSMSQRYYCIKIIYYT